MLWPWLLLLWLLVAGTMVLFGRRHGLVVASDWRIRPKEQPFAFWTVLLFWLALLIPIFIGFWFMAQGDDRSFLIGSALAKPPMILFWLSWLPAPLVSGRLGKARRHDRPVAFWTRFAALTVFLFIVATCYAVTFADDLRRLQNLSSSWPAVHGRG